MQEIGLDVENTGVLEAMYGMVKRVGVDGLVQPDDRLVPHSTAEEHPSLAN